MNIPEYVYLIIALWNAVTFVLFGADKKRAVNKKWRISETCLINCAFLMGGIGALLGMFVFHHKTKHLKFKLLIPLAVVANFTIAVCCLIIF